VTIRLEDIAEALNSELTLKAVLHALAVRYLLEHPGIHVFAYSELEEAGSYSVSIKFEENALQLQLFRPELKQVHEAPLKLVQPIELHMDDITDDFFESIGFPPLAGKVDE
jgi:hypothetical protein